MVMIFTHSAVANALVELYIDIASNSLYGVTNKLSHAIWYIVLDAHILCLTMRHSRYACVLLNKSNASKRGTNI